LQNDRGETALHEALERDAPGSFDAVTLLASAGTDLSRCTAYRETPLHLAARKNRPSTVAMLLNNAAPPNSQDLRGNTALHLAAGKGYHEVVSLLLARPNIELNAPNKEGLTPLHIAVESGFINVVQVSKLCRSHWHELSSLGSWVRIPLEAWMSVCLFCVVLFCVQVAALRRADPQSKESYRLGTGLKN
jgi:hypothetical protein